MRRAQISLFIVAGVVLVILVAILFFSQTTTQTRVPSSSLSGAQFFIEECLEQSANEAVLQSGRLGGFDLSPEHKATNHNFTLHLFEDEIRVPTNPTISFYMEQDAEKRMTSCLNTATDFDILNDPNVDVTIQEKSVAFRLNPIQIDEGDAIHTIDGLVYSAGPVRINRLFDMSYYIAELEAENPEEFCISCMYKLTDDHYVFIDVIEYDTAMMYNITDAISDLGGEPFILVMGHEN